MLLLLVAVVVYALVMMPRKTTDDGSRRRFDDPDGPGADAGLRLGRQDRRPAADHRTDVRATAAHHAAPGDAALRPATDLGGDFALRTDDAGFTVAVHTGWQRLGKNAQGQVRYTGGDFTADRGPRPRRGVRRRRRPDGLPANEPELAPFRASQWASAGALRTLDVGGSPAAEGEYSWRDGNGHQVYARNLALLQDGRYHLVLVFGPDAQRADVQRIFDKAAETYRLTG